MQDVHEDDENKDLEFAFCLIERVLDKLILNLTFSDILIQSLEMKCSVFKDLV